MNLTAEQSARLVSSIELIAQSLAALAGARPVAAPEPAAGGSAGISPAPAAASPEPVLEEEPALDAAALKKQATVLCTELAKLGLNPSTSITQHAGVSGISKVPEAQLVGLVEFLESELAQAQQ